MLSEHVRKCIQRLEMFVLHADPELYPTTIEACEAAIKALENVEKAVQIDEGPHMLTVPLASRDRAIILANKLAKEYNLKCEIKPCSEGRK